MINVRISAFFWHVILTQYMMNEWSCEFLNIPIFFRYFQVQLDNDKIRRDRESRGSRIDLSGLCVSSNTTTTQSIATMRQHTEQRTQSSRVRNSNGLIMDSQGNSIPLSPVSSNTSSGSDTMEQHKPVPMTPSGELRLRQQLIAL